MRAGRVNNAHCKRTHSVARCLSRTRVDASVVWSLLINSSNGSCTTRRSFPIFASMFPLCSPPPSSTSVYRAAVLMVKKKKRKDRNGAGCYVFRFDGEREREGGGGYYRIETNGNSAIIAARILREEIIKALRASHSSINHLGS